MASDRQRYHGLIAATFTPMTPDGDLNLGLVGRITGRLIADGIKGLYVCGSTGEGVSLTTAERRAVAEAYVEASAGRIPIIVQVGHESIRQAAELAAHAEKIGADAVSAIPPTYFRPVDLETVVACSREIASAAPSLDFFYYHIPVKTKVEVDISALVEASLAAIPNFAGVKYSDTKVFELQVCAGRFGDRVSLLFGTDEMLVSGLVAGAHGAVGSTYNFLTKESIAILEAYRAGRIDEARRLQGVTAEVITEIVALGGLPALKAAMAHTGADCGPTRLPLRQLSTSEQRAVIEVLARAVSVA